MRCYVTIDATDPNLAAIRGLAPGPSGLARLGFTVAQHGCLRRWSSCVLHTSVHCYQDTLKCSKPTAEMKTSNSITQTCSFSLDEERFSDVWCVCRNIIFYFLVIQAYCRKIKGTDNDSISYPCNLSANCVQQRFFHNVCRWHICSFAFKLTVDLQLTTGFYLLNCFNIS